MVLASTGIINRRRSISMRDPILEVRDTSGQRK